jgi:DNA-binding NtrC family response regulator
MTSKKVRVLVVDDEEAMREVLEMRLGSWGFDVRVAATGMEGRSLAEECNPDIVISDVVMPELSGLELLASLKGSDSQRPVILITAQGSISLAVEAMKQGAQDFLTKPLDYSKLKAILDKACKDVELLHDARRLSSQLDHSKGLGAFVGTSRKMREVYDLIRDVGGTDTSVIITGESGTGKELAARTIHELSSRAKNPFVPINAAAIPENLIESELFGHEKGAFTGAVAARAGCFEIANRGTLFLDEIAEMPIALQSRLLRVLEDKRVRRLGGAQEFLLDVRVLAATNQDPTEAVNNSSLREDLYYRLNVFTVALPPLRERLSDLPLLSHYFIREFNARHRMQVEGLVEEAQNMLQKYEWPGNVRELRNIMERAVILAKAKWIEPSHLPAYISSPAQSGSGKIVIEEGATLADAERELILRTLRSAAYNKAEAARRLGLDVKTIRNKLKSYGMDS